ncbi:hypothetical protein LINPERHAP2_LOCUS41633 [Linum perenne]
MEALALMSLLNKHSTPSSRS